MQSQEVVSEGIPDADDYEIDLEHSLTKMKAVAACETDGQMFGKAEITEDEAVVKATGDDWGDWSVAKPSTEDAVGEETRACKNDASHTETRTVAKLGMSSSGGCYVATSALPRLSRSLDASPFPR